MAEENFVEQCSLYFDKCDSDGSGTLTKLELYKVVQQAGMEAEDCDDWFDDLDENEDGKVTKDEFIGALTKIPLHKMKKADLKKAFQEMDTDGSGYITLEEFKQALTARGIDPDSAVLNDEDGKVHFAEFLQQMGVEQQ